MRRKNKINKNKGETHRKKDENQFHLVKTIKSSLNVILFLLMKKKKINTRPQMSFISVLVE